MAIAMSWAIWNASWGARWPPMKPLTCIARPLWLCRLSFRRGRCPLADSKRPICMTPARGFDNDQTRDPGAADGVGEAEEAGSGAAADEGREADRMQTSRRAREAQQSPHRVAQGFIRDVEAGREDGAR